MKCYKKSFRPRRLCSEPKHSKEINLRGRESFGARLCAEHQPQPVGTPKRIGFSSECSVIRCCCGWSCGHSRAPASQYCRKFPTSRHIDYEPKDLACASRAQT